MNLNEITKTGKNALSIASLPFAVAAVFIGVSVTEFTNHRQYAPVAVIDNDKKDADAKGMTQFFFNARKDISTNSMNYSSMLAADLADKAMSKTPKKHSLSSSLPYFNWISIGPTATGGRTRAILVDNQDPTHQTVFAGGVTGGIWRSTTGGSFWGNNFATLSNSQDENMANMNINCIAQDPNGAIYVGTGEGFTAYGYNSEFSSGELGGGIFKSTDHGNTWYQLSSTQPSSINNWQVAWAYTNRIAIRSDNFKTIYAATNTGIYISRDSGASWRSAYNSALKKISASTNFNTLDLKISGDASVIVADLAGYGYYCYPQTCDSVFTQIHYTGAGKLNGDASRIEFAISPTDPNRIYASVIAASGSFCQSVLSGIFMTATAKTNGGYWYLIGPGGSVAFDPYGEPASTDDQATYDNTLGVSPNDEMELLAGGTVLYKWNGNGTSDTVGSWAKISHYSPYFSGDPLWIHADEHVITFDPNTPGVVYLGCDGGIFKSTDNAVNWAPYNRNYDVTQYYTVCYAPYVNVISNDNYGNTQIAEGLGMGGGTQDNGSPYINGQVNGGYYPNDAQDMSGGDGAGSVVSQINPNIAYFCSDYGSFERTGNLGNLSFPTSAYTQTIGKCTGGDIDSAAQLGGASFVFPCALYENTFDTLNHDSVMFVANQGYSKGTIIYPEGINGTYPYTLTDTLIKGDTLTVPDRVVSRLAIGFSGSAGGVWVTGQGASNSTVVWIPIGGPDSKPTAYNSSSSIHVLAWSPTGDALFVGDEGGNVFRFSNMNKLIANDYCSAALWWNQGGVHATGNTAIKSTKLTVSFSGRDILAIAVDPNNGNNVLITAGNYNESIYLYYSTNALDTLAAPTFKSVQGNLPAMPVYGCILDLRDQNGNWNTGSAMLATEHGIYTTTNIDSSTVVWTKNNTGMANVMSLAIKQQTMPNWQCNNSGVIYVGTHGRGIWSTNNYEQLPNSVPSVSTAVKEDNLTVYPNPMTSEGNIEFNLASADNVTITIYDMQGKEVKTIAAGTQAPGSHIVSFESNDLQAGTYFASLTGTNYRKVSKFVVVK
jgi:hypothetical protein